jgi:hypothetical protein
MASTITASWPKTCPVQGRQVPLLQQEPIFVPLTRVIAEEIFSDNVLKLCISKNSGFTHKVGIYNGRFSSIRLVISEYSSLEYSSLVIAEVRALLFDTNPTIDIIATDLATGLSALAKISTKVNAKFKFELHQTHFYTPPWEKAGYNLLSDIASQYRTPLRDELKRILRKQGWNIDGCGAARYEHATVMRKRLEDATEQTQQDNTSQNKRRRIAQGKD